MVSKKITLRLALVITLHLTFEGEKKTKYVSHTKSPVPLALSPPTYGATIIFITLLSLLNVITNLIQRT